MEGPSLVILREELRPFLGKKVLRVSGNTAQPKEALRGRTLTKIDTWAKVLFLTFSEPRKKTVSPIVTKTHFLMFGSYRIDDPKPNRYPRIELKFPNGTLFFYSCSIRFDGEDYLNKVDRKVDLMSSRWNEKRVLERMGENRDAFLCDLLLDQTVFAGSGNIVKNEVLFNLRRHPLTKLRGIPERDWPRLARAVRAYCFDFYAWKKRFELRRHWQVYRKTECPVCGRRLIREKLGRGERKTFYCGHCQPLARRRVPLLVRPVLPIAPSTTREKRFEH